MKTVFSRQELIHEAIKKIRFYEASYQVYERSFYRDKASDMINILYLLGVINVDKHILLYRIYMKMFY